MTVQSARARDRLPQASVADTAAAVADVLGPPIAKGVILRRPRMVALAERLDLDRRMVRRMQALRRRYGEGPLMLRLPGRSQALVFAPEDVRRVLDWTPDPFSPDSSEKHAALAHLEPRGSLISRGPARDVRRRFSDAALASGSRMHPLTDRFAAVVRQEVDSLLRWADRDGGMIGWSDFVVAWSAIVRRVVLGDTAREDHELTDMLVRLRAAANWAFLHPGHPALRARFHRRLAQHLARAEPGSLAAAAADLPAAPGTAPTDQVTQWLFAAGPAGIAGFRALALLATQPGAADRAAAEAAGGGPELPFLRAAFLEGLRLWPTTPLILRQTTQETLWHDGAMPAGTGIAIVAPFFHRDDETLPFADRFHPALWLDGGRESRLPAGWPLLPFSGGPGKCPARHLVPLLASLTLAALLERHRFHMGDPGRLDPARPLPSALDPFSLAFAVRPAA